jgi:hypothetical protein
MKRDRILIPLWIFLWTAGAAVSAVQETAAGVLARAKEASGGSAWDVVRSVHIKAGLAVGGMKGASETWDDVLKGRSLTRFSVGPVSGAQGFDGTTSWSQDGSGQSLADEDVEARESAVNSAFIRTMAFWFPQRWESRMEYQGRVEEKGKHFHVVEITPKGGRTFGLWIDVATNLFDRIVDKTSTGVQTTFYSGYREVSGVRIAFTSRTTNGTEKYDQSSTSEAVAINVPLEAVPFAMPAPPAPDYSISGGRTSTTVPFELHNNHIYAQVKIDGRGPFEFLCDTGGVNVMTPELAGELGLKVEGTVEGRGAGEKSEDVSLTKVDKLEIGEAGLANQVFFVYPLSSMGTVEGRRLRGLIGYEVFKRFVVRVDYDKSLLTLRLPGGFEYTGRGTVVPFTFHGRVPEVDGEIDGLPGKFDIDTGSRSSLTIMTPFSEKHDLASKYKAGVEAVTGWGIGGEARALVARAGVFRMGGVTVEKPVIELSVQKKGAFADPYVAGNVGAGVLKRFNLVFDYARKVIVFEKNGQFQEPDSYDRAGMWINLEREGFQVVNVVPAGPAAEAGLKSGDIILAVDGKTPPEMSLAGARARFRSDPTGTKIRLRVSTAGKTREVTLVLRDLIKVPA